LVVFLFLVWSCQPDISDNFNCLNATLCTFVLSVAHHPWLSQERNVPASRP
jgi:hypothetical protein